MVLTPLIGEIATYETQVVYSCPMHGVARSEDAAEYRYRCATCDFPLLELTRWVARDFTDPAVLWPLWERWVVGHDRTMRICRVRTGAFEATVWQSAFSGWARSASVTEAVARAWLAALEATPDG